MREMHAGAGLGQHVRSPVPAVGRFQHDLRALTPRRDLLGQVERIVVDTHRRTDPLSTRGHPHDHAAPPVQVYPHVLPAVILVHKGPPSSWYVVTTPGNP